MTDSLFDRLGGEEGIARFVNDLVDLHMANPTISARFAASNASRLKKMATDFVVTGTGGPETYQGNDMRAVHANMNISDGEFMAVVDDAMTALDRQGAEQRVKEEVLFILYSLRPDVVGI
jgi:hemoglobin